MWFDGSFAPFYCAPTDGVTWSLWILPRPIEDSHPYIHFGELAQLRENVNWKELVGYQYKLPCKKRFLFRVVFIVRSLYPPRGGEGGGGGGGVAWINQLRKRQATRRIPLRRKPSVRSSFFCVVILLVVIVLRGSAIHVFLVRTLFSCCNRVIPVVISNEWKDSG